MRILVTGGLGFIGWEVTRQARGAGHTVVAVDDLSGHVVAPEEARRAGVIVHECRVQDAPDARVDVVVHCASPVGAAGVLGRDCVTEIVTATLAAVRIAVNAGAVLVNISSSEVYGAPGVNRESHQLVTPARFSDRVGYAVGKLAGEHMVAYAHRHHGLRAVSVRPFNVVGPLQAPGKGFVLPRFCMQAWAGGPITVFGDGEQERAFTHVTDLARFILDAPSAPGFLDGGVVNVGADRNQTSILGLAHRVSEQVARRGGPTAPVALTDGRDVFGAAWEEASAGTKLPDASRALGSGWSPAWDLWSIVAESVDHYQPSRVEAAA